MENGNNKSYTQVNNSNESAKLRTAIADIQSVRLSAWKELAQVKKIRAEAEKYRQDMETKARSQAHMVILQARTMAKKEIAKLEYEAREQIQKALSEVLLTAQESLETQQRFADAARICALSSAFQEESETSPESEEEAVGV